MAFVDFTNSPSNGDTITSGGVTYTFNSSKSRWEVTSGGGGGGGGGLSNDCLLYTSPSPRDGLLSRMPSSA